MFSRHLSRHVKVSVQAYLAQTHKIMSRDVSDFRSVRILATHVKIKYMNWVRFHRPLS